METVFQHLKSNRLANRVFANADAVANAHHLAPRSAYGRVRGTIRA